MNANKSQDRKTDNELFCVIEKDLDLIDAEAVM